MQHSFVTGFLPPERRIKIFSTLNPERRKELMEISELHEKLMEHALDNTAKFADLNSKIEGKLMTDKIEINSPPDNSAMLMAAMAGKGGGDGLMGGPRWRHPWRLAAWHLASQRWTWWQHC